MHPYGADHQLLGGNLSLLDSQKHPSGKASLQYTYVRTWRRVSCLLHLSLASLAADHSVPAFLSVPVLEGCVSCSLPPADWSHWSCALVIPPPGYLLWHASASRRQGTICGAVAEFATGMSSSEFVDFPAIFNLHELYSFAAQPRGSALRPGHQGYPTMPICNTTHFPWQRYTDYRYV